MKVKKFLNHMGTGPDYLVRVFESDCSKLAENYHYMFDEDKIKYSELEVLERKINFYTFTHDNEDIIINIYLKRR